jgi:Gas vesicle protein
VATPRKTGFRSTERKTLAEAVLDGGETSLLDLLDKLLNKGVVLNGDVVLGVAGIDLVYLRLSSLLCAIDRVQRREPNRHGQQARRHNRGPRPLKKP